MRRGSGNGFLRLCLGADAIFAKQNPIYVECIPRPDRSLRSKGNGYENGSGSHDGRIPRDVL
jgi:hypothetical protein